MSAECSLEYDRLAWFYDRYWGKEYPRRTWPVLDRLLLSHLPPNALVLDLCCGTGHLTRMLFERGYRVVGLDGSLQMLYYAQEKVPGGRFAVADARAFRLTPRFHGIVSTFESMNHILTLEGLTRAFENAHAALAPQGSFVFDLNMEEAYRTEWGKSSIIVEPDNVCIIRGGYDDRERMGRTDITMFRQKATWQRADVTIFQRCYTGEEVTAALQRAGLHDIRAFDADRELGMAGDLAIGRTFFVCRKGVFSA